MWSRSQAIPNGMSFGTTVLRTCTVLGAGVFPAKEKKCDVQTSFLHGFVYICPGRLLCRCDEIPIVDVSQHRKSYILCYSIHLIREVLKSIRRILDTHKRIPEPYGYPFLFLEGTLTFSTTV